MERTKLFGPMHVKVKNLTAPISWMVSTIIQISIFDFKIKKIRNTRYQYNIPSSFILSHRLILNDGKILYS